MKPQDDRPAFHRSLGGGIELVVSALSSLQLELKASFRLRGAEPFELPDAYEVDAYFVLPTKMHLSPASYPIASFYQDFVAVLRLREPKIFFKTYFSKRGSYEDSPLHKIEQVLGDPSSRQASGGSTDSDEREVKMFALSFERYVLKRTERAAGLLSRRNFADPKRSEQVFVERHDYFRKVLTVLRYWRRVVAKANDLPEGTLSDLRQVIRFADEFCLKVFLRAVLQLLSTLQNSEFPDGPLYDRIHRRLMAYHRLISYASRQAGYITLNPDDTIQNREQVLFHFGWLKRRINTALFLDLRVKPLFSFQQHVGAMTAAAIAGAWAGVLGLLFEGQVAGVSLVGQNAALIVLALTLGYVLKDRIKELGRDRFKNFFNLLPDHVNHITYAGDGHEDKPITIGEISETAYFTKEVEDEDVAAFLRDFHIDLSGKKGESKLLIRYIQSYVPNPRTIAQLPPSMNLLHETMRYDLSALVAKLDSPFQNTLMLKGQKVINVLTPKNYSIGLVVKFSKGARNAQPDAHDIRLLRLKVVINRSGIQRIEPLKSGDTF